MRAWFWTLILASLAVALAVLLREHSGNVLILAPPWRIELSLTLAVLLGLGLVLVVHWILRVVAWLVRSPERVRGWRRARATERDVALLESAWMGVLQGDSAQAQKDLGKLLAHTQATQRKVLTALALARAQHHGGNDDARDQVLEIAQTTARTPKLQALVQLTRAALLLEHGSAEAALQQLQTLPDTKVREPRAALLLLQAHQRLGHHEQAYHLARLLLRRGVLDKAQAAREIEAATVARLAACDTPGFRSLWAALKTEDRTLAGVALQAAAIVEHAGDSAEAARILEAAINAHADIDARLLAAYAHCPPDHVAPRISRAEGWLKLKKHPDHPDVLATLGSLCLIGQLWGQGERYLRRSLNLRPDPRVMALLGNLYERIGRPEEAVRQWRLAANVGVPALTLGENYVLPAADTRDDPSLLDAEAPAPAPVVLEDPYLSNASKEKHES